MDMLIAMIALLGILGGIFTACIALCILFETVKEGKIWGLLGSVTILAAGVFAIVASYNIGAEAENSAEAKFASQKNSVIYEVVYATRPQPVEGYAVAITIVDPKGACTFQVFRNGQTVPYEQYNGRYNADVAQGTPSEIEEQLNSLYAKLLQWRQGFGCTRI
jgi:hypothetical protein